MKLFKSRLHVDRELLERMGLFEDSINFGTEFCVSGFKHEFCILSHFHEKTSGFYLKIMDLDSHKFYEYLKYELGKPLKLLNRTDCALFFA